MAGITHAAVVVVADDGTSPVGSDEWNANHVGAGTAAFLAADTDGALAANSDSNIATQKATKTYVDGVASGLSIKGSCRLATVAALPANTYAAGVLTGVATGTLTVDGSVVALNDRVLVQNEAASANNGIYKCTLAGAVGVAYVLTRSTDMNTNAEVPGAFSFIEAGTVNAGAGFVVAGAGPYTLGTTAIVWTQFSGAGEVSAGTGLTKTGNTLAIDDSTATPQAIGTAAAGTATNKPSADNHVHPTGAGTPAAVSTANATGTGPAAAMTDHVHAHEVAHVAHDTIWDTAGDLVVGSGADTAVKLGITVPAANILEVLGVVNGETTASWKAVHDATAPSTQALGDAAAAGTALTAAHRDHKHAMPSATATASGLTMSTAKMLGRATAATGAIEEIAVTGSGSAVLATSPSIATPTLTGLITASGGQIAFPATQNSSSDANTLDDYERGTWTPALAYGTVGTSTWATTEAVGWYIKIGRFLWVMFRYAGVPTNGTGAGNLNVNGFPFACANLASSEPLLTTKMQGYTKTNFTQVTVRLASSFAAAVIEAGGSAQTIAILTVADIPTGGSVVVVGDGCYQTAT